MIDNKKTLCKTLMKCSTEREVIDLLKNNGYWNKPAVWRYYGDRASNFNTIGNQQSRPDAALVEKLVNSVDARLINESLIRKIDPESPNAPKSIREAVALFFDNGSKSSSAGLVREWPDIKRTEVARGITIAATGYKPGKGNPCFIIADQGEGQTPDKLPLTILSLDRENKVKIPFVQGKFNMGGTGVLEFCGKKNLQFVLSKRNPKLLSLGHSERDLEWGFTIVRREEPVDGRKNSVYTYLAPLGSENNPHMGDVLSFPSDTMEIFPEGQNPCGRGSEWGTFIKLYEYSTSGFSGTNILLSDGLMRQLDLLLTELALPIRIYECRDYSGHTGSYETNLTGIGVRLDDDKNNNLEDYPYSCSMNILGERMTASIYVFKKGKEKTYRQNEGVIFSLNGQTHGILSTSFYKRKKVNMGYLADSILIIVNCSDISPRSREILFMPSRDRLRDSELKRKIEDELEEIIGNHQGLKKLQEKRRREEVDSLLAEERPLGEILKELIKDSPALTSLFLTGQKLPNPFNTTHVADTSESFQGKKFPTYFKFQDLPYESVLHKACHKNYRARICFETDAENSYFQREIQPGSFKLFLLSDGDLIETNHVMNLWNGIATLNVSLPNDVKIGEKLIFIAVTEDETQLKPFENRIEITVLEQIDTKKSGGEKRKKPPINQKGNDREYPSGIDLPRIFKVAKEPGEHEKGWEDMSPHPFNEYSGLRIINAGISESEGGNNYGKVIYDFYINVDNIFLKTEQKRKPSQAEIIQSKFIYAHVLLGLALISHEKEKPDDVNSRGDEERVCIEDKVEEFSIAISSVILPIINDLGELELKE